MSVGLSGAPVKEAQRLPANIGQATPVPCTTMLFRMTVISWRPPRWNPDAGAARPPLGCARREVETPY